MVAEKSCCFIVEKHAFAAEISVNSMKISEIPNILTNISQFNFSLIVTFLHLDFYMQTQNVAILLLQCFVWLLGCSQWLPGGFVLIQRCLDQIRGSYNSFMVEYEW